DEATMSRMVTHYLNLLTDALASPATQIGGLRLLTDSESRQLDSWSSGPAVTGAGWNGTRTGYPADATMAALFAAQGGRNPVATALVFGTGSGPAAAPWAGISQSGWRWSAAPTSSSRGWPC